MLQAWAVFRAIVRPRRQRNGIATGPALCCMALTNGADASSPDRVPARRTIRNGRANQRRAVEPDPRKALELQIDRERDLTKPIAEADTPRPSWPSAPKWDRLPEQETHAGDTHNLLDHDA